MTPINGYEAVPIIKEAFPDIKILVLSMCHDMEMLSDLLDAGVYAIISKADEPEELLRAIVSLSEHRIYRSKLFTEVMYWNKQNTITGHHQFNGGFLDQREKEILQLLWEEKGNKEIADHLYLSIRSIEKIRQNMKEKLGVKSTVGLLKYAIKNRIIGVDGRFSDNLNLLANR
jgi:DNA-binding NarL/FixJ family response regulator